MIAFYDKNGQYLWVGTLSTEVGFPHPLEGKYAKYLGDVDPATQYHDLSTCLPKAMPVRPSLAHIFDFEVKAWVISSENQLALVSMERDKRLAATDWRVVKAMETGIPMDPAWSIYRQALRDITNQSDLGNVVWPEIPN